MPHPRNNTSLRSAPPGSGRPRIVTVLGASGSGKTALLDAWAAASTDRVVRFDLLTDDTADLFAQLTLFLDRLAAQDSAVDATAPRPTLVLVDNVQALADPAHLAASESYLGSSSSHTVVVLAGRRMPPLGWSRLMLRAPLVRVGPEELAALVERRPMDPSGDDPIAVLAGGWARGVQLLTEASEPPTAGLLREPLEDALGEVLDADGRRLLSVAALSPSCSARVLDAVTGRDDSAQLIARLAESPVPMVGVTDDRESRIVVRGALKTLLVDDLRRDDPQTMESTLADLAQELAADGDDDAAFEVLRSIGDRRRMAHFVYLRSAHLALQGTPERAMAWLADFTEDERSSNPRLTWAAAIAAGAMGDLRPVEAWLTTLALAPDDERLPWNQGQSRAATAGPDVAPEPFDPALAPWHLVGLAIKAGIDLNSGRLSEAEGALSVLQSLSKDYLLLSGYRHVLQAHLYLLTGRVARAEAAVAECEELLSSAGRLDHPWMLLCDAAALRCALASGKTELVMERITSLQRKVGEFRVGPDIVRAHCHVAIAAAAVTLGQQTTMARHLALAEPLLRSVPAAGPPHTEYETLRSRLPEPSMPSDAGLTASETRVLRALAGPETVPQIAERLFLGVATVRTHIRAIHRKLHTHNREDTVEAGRKHGLVR